MLKCLVLTIALAGCGSKKAEPTPAAEQPAATTAEPASPTPPPAAPSCESEGGKCINKAAAVTCGTKSHDGGCPESGPQYCCIK